jgi:hypothetical protein
MNEKPKNSTNKNNKDIEQIYGKYTCKDDPSLTLEVSLVNEIDTITFSNGKIIELKNVWGIQGIDKIIDAGIWSRFSNEILIDFRVGWLKLKKLDDDKILIYVKDK